MIKEKNFMPLMTFLDVFFWFGWHNAYTQVEPMYDGQGCEDGHLACVEKKFREQSRSQQAKHQPKISYRATRPALLNS